MTTTTIGSPNLPISSRAAEGFPLGYRPSLDGFRAVAVLTVVAYHADESLAPGGRIGVDLFFVLSGFLITWLLLEEQERHGTIRLGKFFLRRALRLFPALLVLVAAVSAYAVLFASPAREGTILRGSAYALGYCSNWIVAFDVAPMDILLHTWSLSIEEQFYLLWPALLLVLLRLRVSRARIALLLTSGILLTAVWRLWLWRDDAPWRCYTALDARADSLLVGCLAAFLLSWRGFRESARTRRFLVALLPVSALFLAHTIVTDPWGYRGLALGGYTLVALAASHVILVLILWPPRWISWTLTLPVLVWIGRVSYGLYLWHFPAIENARVHLRGRLPAGLVLPAALAFTFFAVAASYYLVERPFLRLKSRFRA